MLGSRWIFRFAADQKEKDVNDFKVSVSVAIYAIRLRTRQVMSAASALHRACLYAAGILPFNFLSLKEKLTPSSRRVAQGPNSNRAKGGPLEWLA
ncbi:hypothetical protein ABIA40_000319 [Bradyrhizobium sp. USDA 223]